MGRKAVRGGHRLRGCRVYPLGHTDPSPAFALHRRGRTALHYAVEHGHLAAVNALIHAGAELDARAADRYAWWALCAAGRRAAESVRASAAAARRSTPLHRAGRADVMAALLGAGADASLKDKYG